MSEKSEIKRDGARAQKNSGRGQNQKGDAIWHMFLVDYKEAGESFGISRKVWAKICTDTLRSNASLSPVLKLILGKDNGKTRLGVIEWEWLEELINCYEQHNPKS